MLCGLLRLDYTARNRAMLSNEQITKYQTLYKKFFNKDIGREEAYEKGAKLIRLVELVYKPMTEAEYQKLQERRRQTGDLYK